MAGTPDSTQAWPGLVEAAQRLCVARDLTSVTDVVRSAARRLANADGATFVLRKGDQVRPHVCGSRAKPARSALGTGTSGLVR